MCRKKAYSAKITTAPATVARWTAAKRLQAVVRGRRARKGFAKRLRDFFLRGRGDPRRRRSYLEDQLGRHTDHILTDLRHRSDDIDNLCAEADAAMRTSSLLFANLRFPQEGDDTRDPAPEDDVDWTAVRNQAASRGEVSCAICMGPLRSRRKKAVLLLSCSHEFHETCLRALEEFDLFTTHLCPCCRSEYTTCCRSPRRYDDDKYLRRRPVRR